MIPEPHHRGFSDRQITHLLDAGRLSTDEVARLAEGDDAARRDAVAAVRVRHVKERLAAAVRLGLTSPGEVADLAERARDETQARQVRRAVNRLARQARAAERQTR